MSEDVLAHIAQHEDPLAFSLGICDILLKMPFLDTAEGLAWGRFYSLATRWM
jgi:hypothetical protein